MLTKPTTIESGQRVRVYYNLRKNTLSIMDKKTRRVVGYTDSVHLENVKFIVSQAGVARIRREQRKSVIAFVEGDLFSYHGLREPYSCETDWKPVYFNPYEVNQFMMGDEPIYSASQCRVVDKKVFCYV